jgi:hypothetical protein
MRELLSRGWDDKADKIINIDFEEVSVQDLCKPKKCSPEINFG